MRKVLCIGIVFLVAVSLASAIEMRRTHEFTGGEEVEYKFLNETYKVKVMRFGTGNGGNADIRINSFERELDGDTPAYLSDLKVSIIDVTQDTITLNMTWATMEEADITFYLPRNQKKTVEIDGRGFVVTYKGDVVSTDQSIIEVNGEEVRLRERDVASLEDGSRVRLDSTAQGSVDQAKISLFASEAGGVSLEQVTWDVEERIVEQQQATLQAKGLLIDVKVQVVSDDRQVALIVMDEYIVVNESEPAMLENGIQVVASQVSLANPRTALIKMQIPDSMAGTGYHLVKKTLQKNQKDEIEVDDRVIRTNVIDITPENMTINVDGEEATMTEGEERKFGDVSVELSVISYREYRSKVVLDYRIPKVAETAEPEEQPEETKEPDINETEEPDMNETVEPEEEPEEPEDEPEPDQETSPEVTESTAEAEDNATESDEETPSLGNTIGNIFSGIGNFFRWLVS